MHEIEDYHVPSRAEGDRFMLVEESPKEVTQGRGEGSVGNQVVESDDQHADLRCA
ncbi:MAG: hypothetical protein ABSF43_16080 [Rectinemataceae bacterium]|jgi:hypothetical protein